MPALGNALGNRIKMEASPEGAKHRRACGWVAPSGLDLRVFSSQGVALGWHVAGPLALHSLAASAFAESFAHALELRELFRPRRLALVVVGEDGGGDFAGEVRVRELGAHLGEFVFDLGDFLR